MRERPTAYVLLTVSVLAEHAPAVFGLDKGGVVSARVSKSDDPAVLDAAISCPMGAIAVYAVETAEQLA